MSKEFYNFGEQGSSDASLNYGGSGRRVVNCTVNPKEVQRALAESKAAHAKRIAEHEEYKRVKKGKATHTVKGEVESVKLKSGSSQLKQVITETTRTEH